MSSEWSTQWNDEETTDSTRNDAVVTTVGQQTPRVEESEKGNGSRGGSSEGSESGDKEKTTTGTSSDAVVVSLRWPVSRYFCAGASESVNFSGGGSHTLGTWWKKEACVLRDSASL